MSTCGIRGLLAMLVSGLLVTGVTQASASVPAAVTRPGMLEIQGRLSGVDAISSSDVWAVGCCHKGRGLFNHWDGIQWRAVSGPAGTSEMSDVDGVSSTDVWAVGLDKIVHWDGARWTTSLSLPDSYLYGVSALSAHNVWVTGGEAVGSNYKTIVLYWNGKDWKETDPGLVNTAFSDVSAISADDVWIVGRTFSGASYIVHWNGTRWSPVSSPDPRFAPASVDAVSPNDVWIVGMSESYVAETKHWDGRKLTVVPCPHPQMQSNLLDVSAVSSTDVWAVGDSEGPYDDPHRRGLTMHWDGASWSKVKAPYAGHHATLLDGVSAIAGDDAWTVGYHYADRKQNIYQVIGRWDGTAWMRVQ